MENEFDNLSINTDSDETPTTNEYIDEYTETEFVDSDFNNDIPTSLGDSEVSANEEIDLSNEASSIENIENINENTTSETTDLSGIYTELEYIDYLILEQTSLMRDTVSGNSINVNLDNYTKEAFVTVTEQQNKLIESQNIIISLVGCVLLAICIQFLFASAKRSVKWFSGRKE